MREARGSDGDSARSPRSLRIFLAMFPPLETQQVAHAMIEVLRRPGDRISWVKRENLHFTLRFIGEVGADGARRVEEAALEAAGAHAAFEAALGGPGAFPNARRARVIWIGLETGGDALVAIARDLERALVRRGFERERQRFSPHLTLGRVREPGPDWTATLNETPAPGDVPGVRFRVGAIQVVESTLSPRGSIYTVRREAVLAQE